MPPAIPPEYTALWRKLSAFPMDAQSAQYPMSMRLADEQGWTREYAKRVVEEYRRFIFLCMISDKMCTPSLSVDEAWHLHLLYTRSYWKSLCVDTLGRLIHHEPNQGGPMESAQFDELYISTLELYARVFGEPPKDIWRRNEHERRSPKTPAKVKPGTDKNPVPAEDQELFFQLELAAARLR